MAALEYDHDTIDIGFGEISTLGSMSADAMILPVLLIHPFAFRGGVMKQIFGIEIPRTLEDVCQPRRLALLVYDMQVGITSQVKDGDLIVERVARTLEAAREAGVRVVFTRHMSLPKELMGAFAYRMAMAWQHLDDPEKVAPWFLRDSPGFALVPDLQPLPSEAAFDKITMSAFEGTPLYAAGLRRVRGRDRWHCHGGRDRAHGTPRCGSRLHPGDHCRCLRHWSRRRRQTIAGQLGFRR
jgi:hypothetical protein